MYLQVTTVCNMSCEHCGMSCSKDIKGIHMPVTDVFKAIVLVSDSVTYDGGPIYIGGGEPTCHPNFWDILGKVVEINGHAGLITNGKITRSARRLLSIMNNEDTEFDSDEVSARLSIDRYHDPIKEEIVQGFKDHYAIHDTSDYVSQHGFARNGAAVQDTCLCSEIMITAAGQVRMCACDTSPDLGHFTDFEEIMGRYENTALCHGECYRSSNHSLADLRTITGDPMFDLQEWEDQQDRLR